MEQNILPILMIDKMIMFSLQIMLLLHILTAKLYYGKQRKLVKVKHQTIYQELGRKEMAVVKDLMVVKHDSVFNQLTLEQQVQLHKLTLVLMLIYRSEDFQQRRLSHDAGYF